MDKPIVRALQEMDLPFVFSSWLRSYKEQSAFAKRIKNDVYYFWHHQMIEVILKKPSMRGIVAHVQDEPDIILGYLIYEVVNGEPKVVHYCFIKEPFRRLGIAKLLFAYAELEKDFFITHFTYLVEPIINKREDITYDPYRII